MAYKYTDTDTILRRCENDLSESQLVADCLALHRAQKTPNCFGFADLDHQKRVAAQDAKRLLWC